MTVTVLCLPYLIRQTSDSSLLIFRIAFLPPVLVLLLQVSFAWTPLGGRGPMLRRPNDCRVWLALAAAGTALLAIYIIAVDPLLAAAVPDYFWRDPTEFVLSLPWTVLCQTLIFVSGVYAFTIRLTKRGYAAIAMVALVHQAVSMVQYSESLSSGQAFALLLTAGVTGAVLGSSYHYSGVLGPVLITAVTQVRHVVRFL